jgi:anion-transporting  ArsA/GET3 family ATPase
VVIVLLEPREHFAPPSLLLQKRTLFFVGKGGVGKTTVAAAFALAAARQGKQTLLVEIEANSRAARLLGLPPMENVTNNLREVSPLLSVLATSGASALEEYLHLLIPMRRLVRLLVESRPYQYFVAAAPGLKELLTIGKVWYEDRKRDAKTQQPRWDLIIVDLPATGHGLQYLQMPRAARDTFSDGIVQREAERIAMWLRDPEKIAVNLVTTTEELPVSETLEACQELREKLHLPLGALFINQVHKAPLSLRELSRMSPRGKVSTSARRLAEAVLTCARSEAALIEAQEVGLAQLRHIMLPFVCLPFSSSREFGPLQLQELSLHLETALRPTQDKKLLFKKKPRSSRNVDPQAQF